MGKIHNVSAEHIIEERPWGQYEILKQFDVNDPSGKDVAVKIHTVKPNIRLSYQSHKFRSEIWVFVQGRGMVVLDGVEKEVKAGDVVQVPVGMKHRFGNIDREKELVLVEVMTGHYDEEDIIRYEDDFGRV